MLRGDSLDGAIVATVAYLDVYACAPTAREIHRFLLGARATRKDVESRLGASRDLGLALGHQDGFWFLAGKEHLAPRRARFVAHSSQLWPVARRIARIVEATRLASAGLVTGSLAADNADEHADVDFLFTYPSDRTWTSYAAVRLLAKAPMLGASRLCPNYVLSEAALEIRPQNLFTAFEIGKAVPMFGFEIYRAFVHANAWAARYLPNAFPLLDSASHPAKISSTDPAPIKALTRTRAFALLEAFERKRKFAAERRDVGVDMNARLRAGSMDRHSPTRSHFALAELKYRLDFLALTEHPLYAELAPSTAKLDTEMKEWPDALKATPART